MTDTTTPFGTYALKPLQNKLLAQAQKLPVNWFGRRGALALRKIVLKSSAPVIDAEVENIKLRLYMRDNVSERKFLFMPQFFDSFERKLIKKELTDGSIFIDIGANAGIYTMTAAPHVGDEGRVLAIEPNPAVLERLTFNAEINGFTHRIITEQIGISDTEGNFDLTLDTTNLGGSSLVESRSDQSITVTCRPLIDVLTHHEIKNIDILKIDIEGAEDKALIPFFNTAPETLHPRFIILENAEHDWEKDLNGVLKQSGYQILQKTRMNTVWKKQRTHARNKIP